MNAPASIYTSENCKAAYQLNWSTGAVLARADQPWLSGWPISGDTVEPDGVRILTHQFAKPGVSQFLVSTRPETAPERLVWSVKGRLQHLVRRVSQGISAELRTAERRLGHARGHRRVRSLAGRAPSNGRPAGAGDASGRPDR